MLQHQNSMPVDTGELIELFISARNLKNLNNIYQSDPECYVYMSNDNDENHSQLMGHTEVSKHNLNPDWKDTIRIQYFFNKHQNLNFKVYDANESLLGQLTELAITGEKKQTFMGSCKRSLAQLMSAKGCLSRIKLFSQDGGTETGTLMIYADKVREDTNITNITWQWCSKNLMKMHIIRGKTDPFAKFFKYTPTKQRILVYQTEVDSKTQDPTWKTWETTVEKLCQDTSHFYVEVWDYNRVGGHQMVGSVNIDINEILNHHKMEFQLDGAKHQNAGTLRILTKQVSKPPPVKKEITFLDYLRGGWSLRMVAGIDFTFSNGPINRPDSLHQISEDKLNYYQQALKFVGQIIISYDSGKQVPLYGFGGVPKLPTYTKPYADDCFPLNGNVQFPTCNDVNGMMETYAKAVPLIEFSGPTFIARILQNAKAFATENAAKDTYTVVMILTDGQIEDMADAFQVIAECSVLPISIIIIGVGDDDFSMMHRLSNIEEVKKNIKSEELKAQARTVTQFVEFKGFQNDIHKLSEKILDRLPRQFMEYMRLNDRKPKPILKAQMSIMVDE